MDPSHARPFCGLHVVGLVARVALKIRGVAELSRIDEHARNHRRALGACRAKQRLVAGVQGAHGRHEADDAGSSGAQHRTEFGDAANYIHVAVASASAR